MKALVKTFSMLIAFLGWFSIASVHTFAEEPSNNSGKMELKTDRIGQDSAIENEFHKETELEKMAPELFEEQTRASIETKQLEAEKAAKNLEKNLFVQPSEQNTALSDTKNSLFSSNYSVQYAQSAGRDANEEGGQISKRMVPALIGFVAVCCGGVYIMMRKMLE
ncbi:type VII secretion protein EssA [Bacillus sp. USDA818B3_A]|uniref:type VII secretion protein EssA n=1 Tax=Bacillus sp. USDA818B3_A TaxID=2698834 RepID=UPI00136A04AB|nr:type VII secretion protein EssA [Bacillus sp. USDA818B3_A]